MEKMKVYIFSKQQFDKTMKDNGINDGNVESHNKIFIISIIDTDVWLESKEAYFKQNHENVLNLRFDDVEHDGEPSPTNFDKGTKAFTEEQANELFEFIKKHRDKETCIVHCMAGISRSSACALFVVGYCKGDYNEFKRENPHICPNARVERMLNQARRKDDSKSE
jgi:predicted protein tyrosine phosphatase